MRAYLRARHALFRTVKAYHDFRRPIVRCDALPLFPPERRRLADALVLALLALAALASWWTAAFLVRAAREILASQAAQAVAAWVRSEPELVRAGEWVWAAVCALPMFVFWVLTIPVWGPVWLAKAALLGAWGAGTVLFRAGIEAGRSAGGLGIERM